MSLVIKYIPERDLVTVEPFKNDCEWDNAITALYTHCEQHGSHNVNSLDHKVAEALATAIHAYADEEGLVLELTPEVIIMGSK